MPGRQAKIITPTMLRRMLGAVAGRETTKRDRVIILLSAKAGLRACEIARLDWSMVLDARGRVADCLAVRDAIAKKRGGRRIPMHASLGRALVALKRGSATVGPVIRSARGGGMRPKSIVNWFIALFASLELEGCSSHSGRRSFITAAARNRTRPAAACATCNCWPVTSRYEMTQGYIDGDTRGQRRLVALLSFVRHRHRGRAASALIIDHGARAACATPASRTTSTRRRAGENMAGTPGIGQ